jgi:CheY-like chemotaxis protein
MPAYTGQQAIDLIDREHPDPVVTDFHLPDLDGLSVLRHARAQSPPIPGILMSAYGSPPVAGTDPSSICRSRSRT